MATKVVVHELVNQEDREIPAHKDFFDRTGIDHSIQGYALKLHKVWYVFCQHPADIAQYLEKVIPGFEASQLPAPASDVKNQDLPNFWHNAFDDQGDPYGKNQIVFIWHGHSGVSALAWFSYIMQHITRRDAIKIADWANKTYA